VGYFSKKPKVTVCDMCGKADVEGCGAAGNHVEQITPSQPTWLPANLRSEAAGGYSWLCVRCNSYPEMAWPSDGGAWASMNIHLGKEHGVGQFSSMGAGMAVNFTMTAAG
jgi:hypothetical protein